jgi:hypothetical protein
VTRLRIFRDLWDFMRYRKKFWLLPMLSVLFLFGALLAVGQSSVGVFVYTLF